MPGRAITVYGQQEVVKDLIAARLAAGGQILFEVDGRGAATDIDGRTAEVSFTHRSSAHELEARLHRRL